MHIADFGIGMLGANGIVAGGISIVTGAGLAAQMEGKGGVAVSFFGDGASNAGPVPRVPQHRGGLEAADDLRLREQHVCGADAGGRDARHAATWRPRRRLRHSRASSSTATTSSRSTRRPPAPSQRARAGDGPTLIECKTYRWRAHTERTRPARLRATKEEIEAWKKKDPIALLRGQLQGQQGELDDADWQAMDERGAGRDRGGRRLRRGEPVPDARAGARRHVCGLSRSDDHARADLRPGRPRGRRRGDAEATQASSTCRPIAIAPLLKEFGDKRVRADADRGGGADRHGHRRGRLGLSPDRRLAAGDVLVRRHGPDRQPGGQDPLHVRRPGDLPDPLPRHRRRRHAARGAALPVPLLDVHEPVAG